MSFCGRGVKPPAVRWIVLEMLFSPGEGGLMCRCFASRLRHRDVVLATSQVTWHVLDEHRLRDAVAALQISAKADGISAAKRSPHEPPNLWHWIARV